MLRNKIVFYAIVLVALIDVVGFVYSIARLDLAGVAWTIVSAMMVYGVYWWWFKRSK